MTLNNAPLALILGGTRGLGRAIALRCIKNRDADGNPDPIRPIIVGRTAATAEQYPDLKGSFFVTADITNRAEHKSIFNALRAAGKPGYVFLTAGIYKSGPLIETSIVERERLFATHVGGPIDFLVEFHKSRVMADERRPYDLVTVGSVLAYKASLNHSVLTAALSAKVGFARSFARELSRTLPGSMSLVVNPWGMKTDFFANSAVKTESFQEPAEVAEVIFGQIKAFDRARSLSGKGDAAVEINLIKGPEGTIAVPGTQMPQL